MSADNALSAVFVMINLATVQGLAPVRLRFGERTLENIVAYMKPHMMATKESGFDMVDVQNELCGIPYEVMKLEGVALECARH